MNQSCQRNYLQRRMRWHFQKKNVHTNQRKKSHAILMCPSCGRRLDLTGSGKSYRCPQAHMTGLPECSNSKMDKVELEETVLACARNMVRFISENLEKKKKCGWKHLFRKKNSLLWRAKRSVVIQKDEIIF